MKNPLRALSIAVGVVLATTALPSIAQQSNSIEIPGYLNPKTGAFRPKPATATPDATAKYTTYTGTFEFEFTITVESKIPSGQEIDCEATSELVDIPTSGSFENVISEQASAIATVKGDTATCTVKIPYSWSLASGAEDSVSLTYALAIVPTSITNETDAVPVRRSSQYLAPITVPKTGTTTTKIIEATI
jgi:hypothetical protein